MLLRFLRFNRYENVDLNVILELSSMEKGRDEIHGPSGKQGMAIGQPTYPPCGIYLVGVLKA